MPKSLKSIPSKMAKTHQKQQNKAQKHTKYLKILFFSYQLKWFFINLLSLNDDIGSQRAKNLTLKIFLKNLTKVNFFLCKNI